MKKLAVRACVIGSFFAFSSFAGIIPGNITVYDGKSGPGWATGKDQGGEDNEVEPGNVSNQSWDLEGFFLDENNNLSMLGGFNFATGQSGMLSGDIFIDVTGDAKYGTSAIKQPADSKQLNVNGWDYAISLNFSTNTYEVFKIDGGDYIKTPYYGSNNTSSPFEYVGGGSLLTLKDNTFTYITGLTDKQTGFGDGLGGDNIKNHNLISGIDLSFLGNTDFTAHFTMGCGNDNLVGKGTVNVPEPGSFSLIGIGLLSLAGLLRFRRKK